MAAMAGWNAALPALELNGQIANAAVHSGVGFNHQANNHSVFANAFIDPPLTAVSGLQNHVFPPVFPVSISEYFSPALHPLHCVDGIWGSRPDESTA